MNYGIRKIQTWVVWMEQEGGSKGKRVRAHFVRTTESFTHGNTGHLATELQPEKWMKTLHQLQFVCPQPFLLSVGISPDKVTWHSLNLWIGLDGCQCGSKNICSKFFLALQILQTLSPIAFQRDYFSPLKSSQLHKAAWTELWPEPSWFLTLNNVSKLLWGPRMTFLMNLQRRV